MTKQREQIKWKIDSHWIHDFKFTLPLILSHFARDVPVIKFVVVIYGHKECYAKHPIYTRVCNRCENVGWNEGDRIKFSTSAQNCRNETKQIQCGDGEKGKKITRERFGVDLLS